jgi:ferredoxin, 2Fe-2S
MPKINFVDFAGVERSVEAPVGWTVRDAAVNRGVPGIVSECGGVCACATCHVYVETPWLEKLPPMSESEKDLLEYANEPRPQSRLSCQVKITAELDGLTVHTPEKQS